VVPNYSGMEERPFRPLKLLCGCRTPIGVGDGKSHLGITVVCAACGADYVVRFSDEVKDAEGPLLPAYYYLERVK